MDKGVVIYHGVPSADSMKNKLMLVMVLLFGFAYADNGYSNIQDILRNMRLDAYPNDVSINILKTMFAGIPFFGGGEDAFGMLFMVFNSLCMVFGGVIGMYTLMLSFSGQTQSGQALGKQNVAMMPLRAAFGTVSIFPVINGYSLINVVFMWLVVQGIGGGNVLTNVFASSEVLKNALVVNPVQPATKDLARNVLLASMCMSAVQQSKAENGMTVNMGWTIGYGDSKQFVSTGDNAIVGSQTSLDVYAQKHAGDKIIMRAGSFEGGDGISDDYCGTITIDSVDSDKNFATGINGTRVANQAQATVIGGLLVHEKEGQQKSMFTKIAGYGTMLTSLAGNAWSSYEEHRRFAQWLERLANEHISATQKMLIDARTISDAIVRNEVIKLSTDYNKMEQDFVNNNGGQASLKDVPQPIMDKQSIALAIDNLATNYQKQFRAQAMETYDGNTNYQTLVKNMHEYGWMMLGTFTVQLSGMTDAVNQIALNTPSSTASGVITQKNQTLDKVHARYMSKLNEYLDMTREYKNDAFQVAKIDVNTKASESDLTAQKSKGFSMEGMLNTFSQWAVNFAISDQEHPLMQMKRLGSIMITTSVSVMTYMFTAGGDMASSGSGMIISVLGGALMLALFTGGITLSYILPMTPTFIWFGMCFGWLVMVMEGMVAVSIWMIGHLTPHQSEDFVGQQRQGYMLTFGIVLRPSLMVLGYIFSLMSLTVVGWFINVLFTFIYSMTNFIDTGPISAIVNMLVVPLLYTGFIKSLMTEMFKIMHKIPDEIPIWFGGHGLAVGGYAEGLGHGSTQVLGAVVNAAASPVGRMQGDLASHFARKAQEAGNLADLQHRNATTREAMLGAFKGDDWDNNHNPAAGLGSDRINDWMNANGIGENGANQKDKIFSGSAKDFESAVGHILPGYSGKELNDAYDETMQEAKAYYDRPENADMRGKASNKDLIYGVKGGFAGINERLTRSTLGNDAAGQSRYDKLENVYNGFAQSTGQENYGLKASDAMMRKAAGIAHRTGLPLQDVAGKMADHYYDQLGVAATRNNSTLGNISSPNLADGAEKKAVDRASNFITQAFNTDSQNSDYDLMNYDDRSVNGAAVGDMFDYDGNVKKVPSKMNYNSNYGYNMASTYFQPVDKAD